MSKIRGSFFSVLIGFTALTSAASEQWGPSVCHRDPQTQTSHCYKKIKHDHFLIGASLNNDSWTYENGPGNWFAGVGVSAEIAYRFLGIYSDYSFKPHVSGNTDYRLAGWSLGLKLGPALSAVGIHPYATAGYFLKCLMWMIFLRNN